MNTNTSPGATPKPGAKAPSQPIERDASEHDPDAGRSVEREVQDDVLENAARRESWLAQMWRTLRGSTGRPSSTKKT